MNGITPYGVLLRMLYTKGNAGVFHNRHLMSKFQYSDGRLYYKLPESQRIFSSGDGLDKLKILILRLNSLFITVVNEQQMCQHLEDILERFSLFYRETM